MKTKLCLLGIIGTLLISSSLAHAATRTWDGGGADNLWTNAANWGGTAPVAGDHLVFPGTAPADSLANTNNFANNTTFGSITITGTNYNLSLFGNNIVLTNGISHQSGGTNIVAMAIVLGANQTFENTVAAGRLSLAGAILDLNGRNLTNNATGLIFLARTISGNGNLIKKGVGSLLLSGGFANTYAGSMTVEEGAVLLSKGTGVVCIPGPLIIGDSVGAGNSAVVALQLADQISDTTVVTIEDDGLLNLSIFSDAISSLTVIGGDVTMVTGPLTLNGDLTSNASTDTATISGHLSLGSATRSFNIANGTANPDLTISAAISGNAGVGITKTGSGSLRLSGTNTYDGTTTVEEGLLELNKTAGAEAITGALTIGDGTGAIDSAIVRLLGANQVNDSSTVTIEDDGLLDLNGNSDAMGSLTVIGGDVTTGAGTLTLGGDVTANASTNNATISGNLSLGSATRSFSIAAGAAGVELAISAVISGDAGVGITKTGGGSLRLSGANTYSGLTTTSTFLDVANPSALGSTSSGTILTGSGDLFLNGVTVAGEPLTNTSVSTLQSSGAAGWSGNVVLNSTLQIRVNSGTNNLSSAISGAGGLIKTLPGTLILSGTNDNTYAGTTTVNEGTLLLNKSPGVMAIPSAFVIGNGAGGVNADIVRLQANSQISDAATITIANSGLLDSDGFTEVVGALSGTGNLQLDSSTFSVGFSGQDVAFDGTISGSGNLIRNGSGTWSLNGTNTFSGNCTLNANTLVNGTLPANSISVSGTLGGTGTVGRVSMAVNGAISPGLSPGRLTTSNLAFIVTSKYRVELNGTTPGSDYDQLKVNGAVNNLASATLNATLGFLSPSNTSFIIIDNDGTDAVTNTFFGLGEGTTFNINGTPFRISYVGGTGNDVVLTQLADTQQPRLNIARAANTNVVLRWGTNFTGFTLEANTNLNTNVWAVVTNLPAVSGTNHVVTNAASGTQRYYRLRAP